MKKFQERIFYKTLQKCKVSLTVKIIALTILLPVLFVNELKAEKPGKQKLNRINFASLYSENRLTDMKAVIYHSSDEKSTVYLDINLKDLLYTTHLETGTHRADFSIIYELFNSYDSKITVDTGKLIFSDTAHFGQETEMVVNFDIHAPFPGEYLLKVTLSDLNRQEKNSVSEFFTIAKTSRLSAQNFMVLDEDNDPVFESSVPADERIRIRTRLDSVGQLSIRYYNIEFPVAKTPFALEKSVPIKLDADSLYTLSLSNGETEYLRLRYPGIYHIQADPMQTEGMTLFSFEEGFPDIGTPAEAIRPLRYLTTQKEYEDLIHSADYKTAVDSFWLQRASNQPERTKNMIDRYYRRVVEANKLFPSYKEGWKTDRGIIYIIYGPPSGVYRKSGEEEWIYGERSNLMSIRFFFDLVPNPFTTHDFELERSSIYKTSWYIAVENWRR
jgi:GWxTD domain-containing protein